MTTYTGVTEMINHADYQVHYSRMEGTKMTPTFAMTIKANPNLTTRDAVNDYVDQLITEHDELSHYRYALVEIVNTQHDDRIEIYNEPDMEGDYVSSTNDTRLLFMPGGDGYHGRAALNAYQSGDWQWTDASSPDDAIRRYKEDDLRP